MTTKTKKKEVKRVRPTVAQVKALEAQVESLKKELEFAAEKTKLLVVSSKVREDFTIPESRFSTRAPFPVFETALIVILLAILSYIGYVAFVPRS